MTFKGPGRPRTMTRVPDEEKRGKAGRGEVCSVSNGGFGDQSFGKFERKVEDYRH